MRAHVTIAQVVGAFAALLGALGVAIAYPICAQAASLHHLYLALQDSTGQKVLRYRLVNGFPERNPDLVFPGVTTPIAVGNDGTFYASVPFDCCQGVSMINVYPLGSTKYVRQITIPGLSDATIDTALAVGPDGYLYVGYDAFISGARPRGVDVTGRTSEPHHGIEVYGPHANGASPPLAMYKFVGIEGGPNALEFGPEGILYVAGFDFNPNHGRAGNIYAIQQPWSGPNIVSQLDVELEAWGLDFSDETRDFYALEPITFHPNKTEIAVYHRGAHGQDRPFRRIFSRLILGPTLAVVGANLFTVATSVPYQSAKLVAYPKDASGFAKPSFERSYPGKYSFTYGVVAGP